jgi:hypothetical protein
MYVEQVRKILDSKDNRKKLISEFQNSVWDDENADEVYRELAYDLDFYEPNEKYRKESTSFYDDKQLEELLNAVLKKYKQNE